MTPTLSFIEIWCPVALNGALGHPVTPSQPIRMLDSVHPYHNLWSFIQAAHHNVKSEPNGTISNNQTRLRRKCEHKSSEETSHYHSPNKRVHHLWIVAVMKHLSVCVGGGGRHLQDWNGKLIQCLGQSNCRDLNSWLPPMGWPITIWGFHECLE